jgi:hypothetical protein
MRKQQMRSLPLAALAAISMVCTAASQIRFTTIYDIATGRPSGIAPLGGAVYVVVEDTGCGYVLNLQPPADYRSDGWGGSVLYTFPSGGSDGCFPTGGPVMGAAGAVYGLTSTGGQNDYGTMYELQPPALQGGAWTESVAYSFDAPGLEIGMPASPLVDGPEGSFYVMATYAGGVLLQLLPPAEPGWTWSAARLAEAGPSADWLSAGPRGGLYVTEADGGIYGGGTVVDLTPPRTPGGSWTETTLYSFGCCSQAAPGDPNTLTVASDGTIYGTTYGEVPFVYTGESAAFSLTPTGSPGGEWTYTMLHYFGENHVNAPLVLRDGNLYGTVQNPEGGAVFELQPPSAPGGSWTITYLHRFANGQTPSGLLFDDTGTLFGMTGSMPPAPPTGTIFKIETK